jgi:enoyl-CoA hydratase/carnithine racemase
MVGTEVTAGVDDVAGIRVATRNRLATVAVDRPDKVNAISFGVWSPLARILPALDADPAMSSS